MENMWLFPGNCPAFSIRPRTPDARALGLWLITMFDSMAEQLSEQHVIENPEVRVSDHGYDYYEIMDLRGDAPHDGEIVRAQIIEARILPWGNSCQLDLLYAFGMEKIIEELGNAIRKTFGVVEPFDSNCNHVTNADPVGRFVHVMDCREKRAILVDQRIDATPDAILGIIREHLEWAHFEIEEPEGEEDNGPIHLHDVDRDRRVNGAIRLWRLAPGVSRIRVEAWDDERDCENLETLLCGIYDAVYGIEHEFDWQKTSDSHGHGVLSWPLLQQTAVGYIAGENGNGHKRRGGPIPPSDDEKIRYVKGWYEVQGKESQECYCSRVGISTSALRGYIRELTARGKLPPS